jgi:hypothetical protein
MKKEYNLSKGSRGKFYNPRATLNLPVYLEPGTYAFVEKIAKRKKANISEVVNDLIKTDMKIAECAK